MAAPSADLLVRRGADCGRRRLSQRDWSDRRRGAVAGAVSGQGIHAGGVRPVGLTPFSHLTKPASAATAVHLAVSSAIYLAYPAGPATMGSMPCTRNSLVTPSDWTAAVTALASL